MKTLEFRTKTGEVVKTITEKSAEYNYTHIEGLDLSNLDLRGTKFSNWCFVNCNFSGANLEGCNLTMSALIKCNFSGANMKNTLFTEGYRREKNLLQGAELEGSNY